MILSKPGAIELGSVALEDEKVVRWEFRDVRPEDAEILAQAAANTVKTGAGASNIIGFEGHQRQIEQMVIALRTAGMLGVLQQDIAEPHRMVLEKADAASEAMHAALRAASRGEGAEKVMAAALRPYRRRTRANVRRLSRKA